MISGSSAHSNFKVVTKSCSTASFSWRLTDAFGKTDSMRALALRLSMLLTTTTLGLIVGCHPIDALCEDGHCECSGNDCICPASGDCSIECTADCDLTCAGSGNCDFICGDSCNIECTGAGNCALTIGPGSTGECSGSGNCAFVCAGPCSISCPGQGDCTLECPADAPLQECSNNGMACGPC
jgi:hypothetical protein